MPGLYPLGTRLRPGIPAFLQVHAHEHNRPPEPSPYRPGPPRSSATVTANSRVSFQVFPRETVVLMVAVPAGTARAQVDCEAARCAVQEALNTDCPCDAATNHGRHVSCVAHVLKRLSKDGTIPTTC